MGKRTLGLMSCHAEQIAYFLNFVTSETYRLQKKNDSGFGVEIDIALAHIKTTFPDRSSPGEHSRKTQNAADSCTAVHPV